MAGRSAKTNYDFKADKIEEVMKNNSIGPYAQLHAGSKSGPASKIVDELGMENSPYIRTALVRFMKNEGLTKAKKIF